MNENEKIQLATRIALKGFDAMVETLLPLNDLTDAEKIHICSAAAKGIAALVRTLNEMSSRR